MTNRSTFRDELKTRLTWRRSQPLSERIKAALSGEDPTIPTFGTAGDLLDFQRSKESPPGVKGNVLAALMRAQTRTPSDAESFELLLAAMLPIVDSRFFQRLRKARIRALEFEHDRGETVADAIWSNVLDAFGVVVRSYPFEQRPGKFAANLRGLLRHELDRREAAEMRQREAETALATQARPIGSQVVPNGLFDLTADEERAAPPTRAELAAAGRRLSILGFHSKIDRALILGVHVEQRTCMDVAHRLGITPAAAWKRIERTRKKFTELRAKATKNDRAMSGISVGTGLYGQRDE